MLVTTNSYIGKQINLSTIKPTSVAVYMVHGSCSGEQDGCGIEPKIIRNYTQLYAFYVSESLDHDKSSTLCCQILPSGALLAVLMTRRL